MYFAGEYVDDDAPWRVLNALVLYVVDSLYNHSCFRNLTRLILGIRARIMLVRFVVFREALFLVVSNERRHNYLFHATQDYGLVTLGGPYVGRLVCPIDPLAILGNLPFLRDRGFLIVNNEVPLAANADYFAARLRVIFAARRVEVLHPAISAGVAIMERFNLALHAFLNNSGSCPVDALQAVGYHEEDVFRRFSEFGVDQDGVQRVASLRAVGSGRQDVNGVIAGLVFRVKR